MYELFLLKMHQCNYGSENNYNNFSSLSFCLSHGSQMVLGYATDNTSIKVE